MNLPDARFKIDRGSLSEEEAARLRDWVLDDPTALEQMAAILGDQPGQAGGRMEIPASRNRSFRSPIRAGAMGLLALAGLGAGWLVVRSSRPNATAPPFPTVTVYESNETGAFKVGQAIHAGRYDLGAEDAFSMVFTSGARVDVKGPGGFEILGERRMVMHEGLLRARIEDHLGPFQIDTPEGRVVDLGTAFTVARTRKGSTEVHVDEGSVRLEAGGKDLLLHENEAAAVGAGGMTPEDYLKHRFDTPLELHEIVNAMKEVGVSTPLPWQASWNLTECRPGEAPPLYSGSFKLLGGVVAEGLNYESGGYALKTTPNAIMTGSTMQGFECSVGLDTAHFPRNERIFVSFLMRLPEPVTGVEKGYAGLSFQSQNRWESFFVGDGWYKEGLCMHDESPGPAESRNQEIPLGVPLSKDTVLVVLRLDPLRKVTDVWVNPPLGLAGPPESADARWQNMPEFDLLGLRSGRWFHEGGYTCIFDELRLGSDWSSVLPLDKSK